MARGNPAGVPTAPNDTRATATGFLGSYQAAFEGADAVAILDHFAFPCHITSEAREITLTSLTSREDGERMVEQLLDTYQRIGVSSARLTHLATSEISPRLVQTLVHWVLEDAAGSTLYAFEAVYTLASIGGPLRICAIAHNEIPRYREYLARISSREAGSASG